MTTQNDEGDATNSVPTWCPDRQIYIGGVVPDNSDLDQLLAENSGALPLFGYGSLCWNPGEGATLSKFDDGVQQALGRAVGWKRCWAQRSADHRGMPSFQGLVCTLLTDGEVDSIRAKYGLGDGERERPSLTEGVLYTVPPHLVKECLEELDFREKGGYERDVIDVVRDDNGKTIQALLYRGTPTNPAFWNRALLDLPFAAAIMTVAVGPSGPNSEYLLNLDRFLFDASPSAATSELEDVVGDLDTRALASMSRSLSERRIYFLFGCGSNQHRQLQLSANAGLKNGDEAHDLKEIVITVPRQGDAGTEEGAMDVQPVGLYCGGGHSAMLTRDGSLYLWGWNEHGQLGRDRKDEDGDVDCLRVVNPLEDILVKRVALGHSHTLVIDTSGNLYAFGDNGRGQVDGTTSVRTLNRATRPHMIRDGEIFVDVAAGLFHSAAINSEGELLTFGCKRFGQCIDNAEGDKSKVAGGRWRPEDGTRLVGVACGHRHTVVLDEEGRVYSMGSNKYGQLGLKGVGHVYPHPVAGALGRTGSGCYFIDCGWSHNIALVKNEKDEAILYGWGRNDKGQLGSGSVDAFKEPKVLLSNFDGVPIRSISCGSECTMILDHNNVVRGTGWNEHGNLGVGSTKDIISPTELAGARITAPPPWDGKGEIIMAAGGAHFLVMKVFR